MVLIVFGANLVIITPLISDTLEKQQHPNEHISPDGHYLLH